MSPTEMVIPYGNTGSSMGVFGKFLQVLGLALLPLSIILDLLGGSDPLRPFGVSQMVLMLGFGMAIFYIGRILEGYSN